jgi:hypothetical protein
MERTDQLQTNAIPDALLRFAMMMSFATPLLAHYREDTMN